MDALLAGFEVSAPESFDTTPDLTPKQLAALEKHKQTVTEKMRPMNGR